MATVSPDPITSCCSTETRRSAWRRSPDAVAARTNGCAPTAWRTSWPRGSSRGPPPGRAGAVHHDRSGPDGRPDARGQQYTPNGYYQLVLPAAAWLPACESEQYQRGAVAARQGGRLRRDGRAVVAVTAAAAPGVSAGAHSRSARRGLCQPGGLRLPGGAAAARLRDRDGEERGVGAVRRAGHAGGAGADVAQRTDRARLQRDPSTRPARGTTRAAS